MRIWIDGQCFQTSSKLRGIGRYVEGLIKGIRENRPDVELVISFNAALLDEGIAARDHVAKWFEPENIHIWQGAAEGGEVLLGYTARRQLSELALKHHVVSLRPDVALAASPFEGPGDATVPLLPSADIDLPVAAIFYDAIPHRFPEKYLDSESQKKYYYRRLNSLNYSVLNLCISEFSKNESLSLFKNVNAVNIGAGIDLEFDSVSNSYEKKFFDRDFILYVGGLDWRKNIGSVIESLSIINDELSDPFQFLVVGDGPIANRMELENLWAAKQLPKDGLKILSYVSDRQLVSLYRNARVVVQPSFMEGFGMTAAEAMRCGAPMIAAAAGALPEVIGDESLLFDPYDARDLARLLLRMLKDENFRNSAVARGRRRSEIFTWNRTASLALEGLTSVRQRLSRAPARPLNARRHKLASVVHALDIPLDFAAKTLAIAETQPMGSRRLIVEATSTSIHDHESGIQRVVKSICSNVLENRNDNIERLLAYSDDHDGFFCIGTPGNWKLRRANKNKDARLIFNQRDVLVLLDSSWTFHHVYAENLMHARIKGAEVVSCLYDTVPLRYSAFCNPSTPPIFSAWFKSALRYSTSFVCISQAVADELYNILQAIEFPRPMRIGYWHLGADFQGAGRNKLISDQPIRRRRRPIFLMVGTLEPRKGHRVVLDAFDALWQSGFDAELIIVGKLGWCADHVADRIRNHPEKGSRLHWYNSASDSELHKLYADCDALVAASFAEGFGLPIVEAAHYGKPIIASDIPVFREVTGGGQACRFFEVGSSSALAATIRNLMEDLSAELAPQVGSQHWLSWAESAAELESVVLRENWYRTYEPAEKNPYVSIADLGQIEMREAVPPSERAHRLELLEGPIPGNHNNLRYLIRVTNASNRLWSSQGSCGVGLGYRVLNAEGIELAMDSPRSTIPFVLISGDSHCMAIEAPIILKEQGGAFLDIELIQEGVGWWGNPLRVAM